MDITRTRSGRLVAATAATCAVVLLAAGCGGAPSSGAATGSAGGTPTIDVGVTLVAASTADLVVAQQLGYFKQAKVDVNIKVEGASVQTDAAAGRIDLALTGATAAFPPAAQGHPTQVVYAQLPNATAGSMLVAANSRYQTVMDLAGQKVAVLGHAATYAAAVAYSKYIQSQGGKPLDIVSARDSETQVSGLLAGQFAGFVGEADLLANQVKAGKVRLLVDSTSTQGRVIVPPDIVGPVLWGLKANITAKKQAVTRFVAGLRRADTWIHSATTDQIVSTLAASPLLKGTSSADLALQVPYDLPLYSPTNGYISQAAWQASLKSYQSIGIEGVDVTSSQFGYGAFVDMSYWNAAA